MMLVASRLKAEREKKKDKGREKDSDGNMMQVENMSR